MELVNSGYSLQCYAKNRIIDSRLFVLCNSGHSLTIKGSIERMNCSCSALCFPSGTAQVFQTCYDNATANCTGNVVTGVSTAQDCCLGDGFWFRVSGRCLQCIGK